MKAIKISPISLTVPMLAFTPLFLLITSPLILGELPNFLGLTGILLVVSGTYTLSIKDVSKGYFAPFKTLLRNKGSLLMLFVAIIYSITANVAVIGIQHSDPIFFPIMSNAFTSGLLFPVMLMRLGKSLKGIRMNLRDLFLTGLFSALTSIFFGKAIELATVLYVASVKRTSIFFSILYGYFFFKEKRIMERLLGALIMVLGILVMSLFGF